MTRKDASILKASASLVLLISIQGHAWKALASDNEGTDPPPPKDLERINVKPLPVDAGWWPLPPQWVIPPLVGPTPTFSFTAPEQETDERANCSDAQPGTQSAGNPVVLYTGNKIEPETDFHSQGEMGLYLRRVYNHQWSAAGIFGNHWISNFDYSLVFSQWQDIGWAQRPDGRRVKFLFDQATQRWYEDRAKPVAYIVKKPGGGFELHGEDRRIESYNAEGFITQIRNEQGVVWNFLYSNFYLQSVTHSSGRSISFRWNGSQLAEVVDPSGSIYRYTYDNNALPSGRGRLASTTLPGTPSTLIQYHYEDARYPGGLTGKSFNGVRYSTFAYDGQRRAISTEHSGGVEKHQFSYTVQSEEQVIPPPQPVYPGGHRPEDDIYVCGDMQFSALLCMADGTMASANASPARASRLVNSESRARAIKSNVTVTNPLGRRTTYSYEDGRQVSVAGDPSPRCAASFQSISYDSNGYPSQAVDFNGNNKKFDYDTYGRLTRTVEASGSSVQRTTTQIWSDEHRLVKKVLEGAQEVSYTYDALGNISSVSEKDISALTTGTTHTTHLTYTYHANKLKSSIHIDGPLANDDITYLFNAQGDLTSVTNGLGHKTTYADHTALGAPRTIIDPNGHVEQWTLDARGRVLQKRSSDGQHWLTTKYTYDPQSNLVSIVDPLGTASHFKYDAAGRMIQQWQRISDGSYTLTNLVRDSASNVIRKEIRHANFPGDSAVIGAIDGINHDGQWNWYATDWACSTGYDASINVVAYAEAGAIVATGTANMDSEPSITSACQASESHYRYSIPLALIQRQTYGGQILSVYGQSPMGASFNRALANPAALRIPFAGILGDVSGVTQDGNWNFEIQGWACSVGTGQPILVEAYAGGAAGQGAHIATVWANQPADSSLAAHCQANATAYGYRVPLSETHRRSYENKPLHLRGVSTDGALHAPLTRSGAHLVPGMRFESAAVGFRTPDEVISSGDTVPITITFRNTGNVIWKPGDVVLRWGDGWMHSQRPLLSPVPPGADAVFTIDVMPIHLEEGLADVVYYAQMATGNVTFGPQSRGAVSVYRLPLCNPVCVISFIENHGASMKLAGGRL